MKIFNIYISYVVIINCCDHVKQLINKCYMFGSFLLNLPSNDSEVLS